MDGKENLIPLTERSKDEQRKIRSMGGKASGKARRKRKAIKEQLEMFLSLPLKDDKAKTLMKSMGVDIDDIDNQMALVVSMWKQALSGNVQAFNSIRDTVGERPIEKVEVANKIDDTVKELEKMLDDE